MADERARSLRKRMTTREVKLWVALRALRPQGLHFRRQVPLERFIVDFACLRARLVVEIDGEQHGFAPGLTADRIRDAVLKKAGYRVLRFWNHEVDRTLDAVVETIYRAAVDRQPPSGTASPCRLPPLGEG